MSTEKAVLAGIVLATAMGLWLAGSIRPSWQRFTNAPVVVLVICAIVLGASSS